MNYKPQNCKKCLYRGATYKKGYVCAMLDEIISEEMGDMCLPNCPLKREEVANDKGNLRSNEND